MASFLVGGYGADMDGHAAGIGLLHAGAADDVLAGGPLRYAGQVAAAASPSWVAWHPTLDVVYAALEGAGSVQAFRRTGETAFVPLGAPVAAGESPCHVAVAPDGGMLLVACWTDGRIVRMPLDADGRPGAPSVAPPAADPYAADGAVESPEERDVDLAAAARALRAAAGSEFAHLVPDYDEPAPAAADSAADTAADPGQERVSRSHQSVFLPGGVVATTDMGVDLVRFWRVGETGLRFAQQVVLPRGSGPRHMAWHPSGHLYVVTELSHEVFVLAFDRDADAGRGAWRILSGTPLAPGIPAGDTAAEISLSRDAAFVYAGVRGSDTIATLRVRSGGSGLQPVALAESGVRWPRHHLVVRDTLLVAGQLGDDVASLALDERTGVPGRVRHRAEVPSPTCLVPLR